jgi:hypothetical protein
VLYVGIASLAGFGIAYSRGLFTPGKPVFAPKTVSMTTPQSLLGHTVKYEGLSRDAIGESDVKNVELLADVLSNGLKLGKDNGDSFVSWSTAPFDSDYGDFRLKTFRDIDPSRCLIFLYSTTPTRFGTLQYCLRQLYFETDPDSQFLTTTFQVRSPKKGDLLILFFWAGINRFDKRQDYNLTKVASL